MSSYNAMNPTGGATIRRVDGAPDPNLHLLERILSTDNVKTAWERVKANKGAPGVDNVSIDQFPDQFRPQWKEIRQSILAGTYQPSPVKRAEIAKATGGTRLLGIPRVLDRLIQQAICQILTPIFDHDFSNFSFGFRPGRSAHDAIKQAKEYIREGYRTAVDTDLAQFFDTVDHDALMCRIARKVRDKRVLSLIGKFLRAGARVSVSIRRFLERRLKLTVNEKKSRVGPTDGTEYLGFVFKKFKVRWSDKAFSEFKQRVRKLTGRSKGISLDYRLKKLALYVRGWMNYFGISEYYDPVSEIDSWLRRRIRACLWKQWKRPRTRIRELRRMGTSLKSAIFAGISRKGPWCCARTKATQIGISNQWLANMGLICIKDLWVKIHYPAKAR